MTAMTDPATEPTTGRLGRRRERAPRHPPELWRVPVLRTARITPRMVRITVGDPSLANFPAGGGDQHVVLYLYPDDAVLPEPLTLTSARVAFNTARPWMRSYTVRRFDPERRELDLDFVLHQPHGGPAADWVERATPGDPLIVVGPSPAYRLDPDVGNHLLIGDETAIPAIAALLGELPAGVTARAVVEVADADERQPLGGAADIQVQWLYRDGAPAGQPDRLLAAVRALDLPAGAESTVWAAGERGVMLAVRSHLLNERGLARARIRTGNYWRVGQVGTA